MPRQSPRKNYTVLSRGLLFSYILLLLVPPPASSRRLPILAMTRHSPDGSPPSHPALLLPRISPPLGISPHCRLILASQSPRRREILDMMGLAGSYEVIVSSFDESTLFELKRTADPTDYVKHSACQKAADVCSRLSSPEDGCPVVVIGSDTVVDLDGDILEKPRDEAEAADMLKRMSGRTHLVHTGVALYSSSNGYSGPSSNFSVSTKVSFPSILCCNLRPCNTNFSVIGTKSWLLHTNITIF